MTRNFAIVLSLTLGLLTGSRILRPASQPMRKPDKDAIDDANPGLFTRCGIGSLLKKDCHGYRGEGILTAPPNDPDLADWMSGRQRPLPGDFADRPIGSAGETTRFTIHAIKDADKVWVKKLNDKGIVMARIDADPTKTPDSRYGIGKSPDHNLTGEFYIVVDRFNHVTDSAPDDVGVNVSRWFIYAVEQPSSGKRALVKVGNSGIFRVCREPSSDGRRDLGATFATCVHAHQLMKLDALEKVRRVLNRKSLLTAYREEVQKRERRSARATGQPRTLERAQVDTILRGINIALEDDELRTFAEILAGTADGPAWMLCGLGCCTADSES